MKWRMTVGSLLAVAILAGGVAVRAEEAKTTTVEGEILDLACFVAKGAKGKAHAGCAKGCVQGGQPMGLLTADGTVYVLYASHENKDAFETAKEHAGQQVAVEGLLGAKNGLNGIEVHAVKPM